MRDDNDGLGWLRPFWERFLPSRGWARVLVVGNGARAVRMLLEERGYDVTVAQGNAWTGGRFDALVSVDADVPRELHGALRRGGVVVRPGGIQRPRRLRLGRLIRG